MKNEKGDMLLEIPATIGVIGVVLVPWLAAFGAIAALAKNCKIVVKKREQVAVVDFFRNNTVFNNIRLLVS